MDEPVVVAVDPGRDKCGVAFVTVAGAVLRQAVVPTEEVATFVARHAASRTVTAYAVGDGTAGGDVADALRRAGAPADKIVSVDETYSSEIGRRAYWRARPPRGWRRLLPVTLQTPPEPYDDFVAVELARRFLNRRAPDGERTS